MIRPRTQLSDQIWSCSFTIDLYPVFPSSGCPVQESSLECRNPFRVFQGCMRLLTLDNQPVDLIKVQQRLLGNYSRLQIDMCGITDRFVSRSHIWILVYNCCYSCYTSHRRLRHVMQHRANMHIFTCHQSTFIFLFLFNSSHDVPTVCVLCCGSKWFLQTFWDLWKQSWTVTLRMIYLYFASGLDRKHHTNIIVIIMYYPDTVSPFAFSIRYTGGKFNFISCRPLWSKLRTKYWQKQGAVCRHWVQQTVNKAN